MTIDWKAVSQSQGYRSLKAAYMHDAHEAGNHKYPRRSKAELLARFRWVIGRAQHYAVRQNRTVEEVLNEWEDKRGFGWLNFYQESNQPKLPSGKPRNVQHQGFKRYLRNDSFCRNDPAKRFQRIKSENQRLAHFARKEAGKKARWTADRKRKAAK